MKGIFINEAFDNSIKDYLKLHTLDNEIIASSFNVMVLKMLAVIYGEIDIINPYIIRNERSFKLNIMKFGYSEDAYNTFINDFLEYYKIEQKNTRLDVKINNPYFVKVQKDLIDMFILKKTSYKITEAEEKNFFDLLYTTKTSNPLKVSYNYLTASDINEVENYYYEKLEAEKEKLEVPKKSNVLNIEAYEILNYSLTDIANMDADSVDEINENVYEFFEIDDDAENKTDLLNAAISNYKKSKRRFSTGNGYVDILLIMGVVVTGILLLTVATLIIL